jgi:peptidoglycan/LPS O-acetylase OafA/YrhL
MVSFFVRELHSSGTIDISKFYLLRLLRLYPMHFVCALVFWAISYFDVMRSPILYAERFFLHRTLLMAHNYFISPELTIAPHSWTVAVEIQFQLIFPWIFLFLWKISKGRIDTLLTIFVAFFVVLPFVYFLYILSLPKEFMAPFVLWTSRPLEVVPPQAQLNFLMWVYLPTHMRLSGYIMGVIVALALNGDFKDNYTSKVLRLSIPSFLFVLAALVFVFHRRVLFRFDDEVTDFAPIDLLDSLCINFLSFSSFTHFK